MRTTRAITVTLATGALLLAPACSDEDNDGGTTDEELQDVEDRVDEEIDAQNEGSNEDDE